jgi:hypothetical protein
VNAAMTIYWPEYRPLSNPRGRMPRWLREVFDLTSTPRSITAASRTVRRSAGAACRLRAAVPALRCRRWISEDRGCGLDCVQEGSMRFADVIVELEATDDEKKRWRKITSELKAHKGIRNFVAHYGSRATTRRCRTMSCTQAMPPPLRSPARAATGADGRLPSMPTATLSVGAGRASSALKFRVTGTGAAIPA